MRLGFPTPSSTVEEWGDGPTSRSRSSSPGHRHSRYQIPENEKETETDRAADENGLALGDYKRVAIS